MHRKNLGYATLALSLSALLGVDSAQEAGRPAAQFKSADSEATSKRPRVMPPVTGANVNQLLWRIVQAARRGDFKAYSENNNRYVDALNLQNRVVDYPQVTLKRLAPYATHPSDAVRDLVQQVAGRVLYDAEAAEVHADALSLLIQVISKAEGESSSAAVVVLRGYLFARDSGKRESFRKKIDMVALKRALVRYLSSGFYVDDAMFLLTLLAPDASLKPLVDSVAKRDKYSTSSLIGQSAWGDGNAIEALRDRMGSGDYIEYLAKSILIINEPTVLGSLWKHLDDKREVGEYPASSPNGGLRMIHPRACDFALAALKIKFDKDFGDSGMSLERTPIATDEELAKAKEHFRTLINALPQIGEQVGVPHDPL